MPVSYAGRVLAGRYRLDRHLAEGGMGEVWVAHHLTLDVPVAVKLMSLAGESRQDLRKRFEREAKAVAQLKSPHVVQIFDYGTDDERPFIVMELLRGTDLLELLRFRPKWALPEVAGLVFQVTKGLTAAHALGIIHRDIKPGNIFLTRSGDEVTAKILDFGIAKITAAEQQITATNAVLGSPYYLSPEQLRSEPLDARVDLWALAVVTYRLVTGHVPYDGDSGYAIAENILRGEREEIPTSITRGLELEKYFRRALADKREDRFATPAEFAEEFFKVAGPPGSLLPVLDPLPDAPTLKAPHVVKPPAAARAAPARPAAPEITEDTTEQQEDAPTMIGKRSPAAYLGRQTDPQRDDTPRDDTPRDEPSMGDVTPTEIHRESLPDGPRAGARPITVPPRPARPGLSAPTGVPRVGRPPPHTRVRTAPTTRMTVQSAPPPAQVQPAPPAAAVEPAREEVAEGVDTTLQIPARSRGQSTPPRAMPSAPPEPPPAQPQPQPQPQPMAQPLPAMVPPQSMVPQPTPSRPPMPMPQPHDEVGTMKMTPAHQALAQRAAADARASAAGFQPQPTMQMPATATPFPVRQASAAPPAAQPPPNLAWNDVSSVQNQPQAWSDVSSVQSHPQTWSDVSSVQGRDPGTVPQRPMAPGPRGWLEDDANETVQMRRGAWSSPPVLILIGLGTLAFVFFTWAVVLGLGK